MSRGTAAALGEVVRVALRGGGASFNDRDLLARFANGGDQAAFAALFRRHSGMVLGVCRRALSTVQDAEDACQATFLLLARRARSGRWQPSVANWLYTSARRVAANARRAAERRARREKKAAVEEAVQPVDRMTGRELLDALDVELDRLPPAYREPLVLCYLEGLTRDEAAARLGLPPATVKTRLERGRKRLGDALTRRGCAPGAGLLALAATSPAEASPLRLLRGALTAAAGSPPPAVAALTGGIATPASARTKLFVALAGVCLLGVGLGTGRPNAAGLLPETAPESQAAAPENPGAAEPDRGPKPETEVLLKGRVSGVDGKAFAGAKLCVIGAGDHPTDLGVSGADGRFTTPIRAGLMNGYLVARAEGYGFDFRDLGKMDLSNPAAVELRLVKDNPVRGRVVDTQGKPVAGVRVRGTVVGVYANDSLDSFLEAWKAREHTSGLPATVKYFQADLGQLFSGTTDAEGRFTLRGLGAERVVHLRTSKLGIADAGYWTVNRDGFDPRPYNEANRLKVPKGYEAFSTVWLLHGPDLTAIAEAEKPIRGVVTAAETGKGRPGVVVHLTRGGGKGNTLLPFALQATTDAGGRYEIRGARKADGYMVEVEGDTQAGYMPCQVRATDTVGYEPVVADIRVVKGVVVTGRLIDRSTGKGVPGFVVVDVLNDNPFAKDYPTFGSSGLVASRDTADDGAFRVVAMPGPVILMGGPDGRRLADGWDVRLRYKQPVPDPKYPQYFLKGQFEGSYVRYGGGYSMTQGNWCKVLDIKPGTATVQQDILLEPATELPLLLRDEAGKPLTGVQAAGLSPKEWFSPVRCKTPTCAVYDLEPGKRRLVVLFEPVQKLAASVTLKGGEEPPAVVTLRPTGVLKGRVVGPDGGPLTGFVVGLHYRDRAAVEVHKVAYEARQVLTGPDGSFTADSVLPGLPFDLSFVRQGKVFRPASRPPAPLTVEAARTKDVGDLAAKRMGGRAEE